MSTLVQNITNLFSAQQIFGLEIHFTQQSTNYRLIELKKSKNKVEIIGNLSEFGALEDLGETIRNKPVAVSFTGKGVIQKSISINSDEPSDLISHILPNADPKEFLMDHSGEEAAVIRKSQISEILKMLKEMCFIFNVYIGSVTVSKLENRLNQKFEYIEDERVKFVEEEFSSKTINAYAVALNQFIDSTSKSESKSEYNFYRLYKIGGISAIALLFVGLLTNFLIFNSYQSKNAILEGEMAIYGKYAQKFVGLKKEYDEKVEFLDKTGWYQSSKASFYADRIASTLPKELLLTEMDLFPLDHEHLKLTKEKRFLTQIITVAGVCRNSIHLDRWITKLNKHDWIASTTIQDFEYERKSGKSKFFLIIELI